MSKIGTFHKVDIIHQVAQRSIPDAILLDGFEVKGVQSLTVVMDSTAEKPYPIITIRIIPRELHEIVEPASEKE